MKRVLTFVAMVVLLPMTVVAQVPPTPPATPVPPAPAPVVVPPIPPSADSARASGHRRADHHGTVGDRTGRPRGAQARSPTRQRRRRP